MALSPAFLEELRARTPVAAVVGRRVKLARSGRQMKGCCPFHNEKTASFYVYEDGYHCFGCGAHGDAISFVMQTQGAGFMEAVGQLAAEAGLEMPKPSPEAAAVERRQRELTGVLEAAAARYQRRLALPEGRRALAYLHGRGLSDETIRHFGLGWSGEGRRAISAELARDGVTQAQLVEVGLMRRDEDTGRAYDLFFNRVMFPIRDRRGRVISFGGRILGDGQPKYVNGPETAAWLVWLRSRLPLPLDSPAQQQAEAEAGQLRENLLALRAAQGLAAWLADRPQLGSEVIARGAPEWVGTALAASYQVDVVGFLWASMALFDDGSRDVDTDIVYRPPWHDLLSTRDARERILALLASQPDGASLERFLPAHDADDDRRARPGLRRRSALASTLLGSLELTRQGDITLAQQEALLPIHLRRANAGAAATTGVLNSDHLVTA